MAEQPLQERTEKATVRRREKAREEGRVAKSVELNSAVMVVIGGLMLWIAGSHLSGGLQQFMRQIMANAPTIAGSDPTFASVFTNSIGQFFGMLGPVFALTVSVAVLANVAQVGFKITPKAAQPKFEKLDVIRGLKRLFSLRSLVTLIRDSIKLMIIGFIAYKAISAEFDEFFLLPDMSVSQFAVTMVKMSLTVALKVGAGILVIAILDFIYQRYEHEKSIRMTKQEVRDELKDTEGNPQIKARVRQIQREMSRKRMMADVTTADVVITNPVHLAVALKYDLDLMSAPQVVAKGARLVAEKIKEIAREHDIPIVEDRPLARALYKVCEVGDVVPQKLYRAVAEILAYVYRLKKKVTE
ncbi:MAG: flagellar biosynthesis protein FlhB [Candidatus Zixiibacteriota bacterium]|nr:MAG: flagellar biosynthesis protein FlhB [candidate division Zixibacteria bacterium]